MKMNCLKSYQFILKANMFKELYITVYGVNNYSIAKEKVIDKIRQSGWCNEMIQAQIEELNEDYNSEEETEIENGTIDFPH